MCGLYRSSRAKEWPTDVLYTCRFSLPELFDNLHNYLNYSLIFVLIDRASTVFFPLTSNVCACDHCGRH
jgi:hypothetical protein